MAKSYVVSSFFWGFVSKISDAGMKFISVPLLLAYFGKQEFGLIALATSVNAYLQLLDMGINTGAVKYFSEWISLKNFKLLDSVARTSISFYGIVGLFNAILLLVIAFWGIHIFSVTDIQVPILRKMFSILAVFAIINWSTSVFNQLITANEKIAYVQQMNLLRSLLNLGIIFATIWLKWNIISYFILFTAANSVMVVPFYLKAKKDNLISSFIPGKDWKNFGIVFKYSIAIILMVLFQMSATKLRPIVLSVFSKEGVGILADYRIMETITIFIISIGGMFISIFMPKTSKLLLENDKKKVQEFAYNATLYTSVVCVLLCMPFVICGEEILNLYVGPDYGHLSKWLIIWVLTILFFLHNSPVASLVLATGKTRMLVYSSALACTISLVANAILAKYLGVGSAIVGYSIYILIQMSFYYFYFNKKVLELNSWLVFKSFIIPASLGFMAAVIVHFLNLEQGNLIFQVFIKLSVWVILFASLLFGLGIVKLGTVMGLVRR